MEEIGPAEKEGREGKEREKKKMKCTFAPFGALQGPVQGPLHGSEAPKHGARRGAKSKKGLFPSQIESEWPSATQQPLADWQCHGTTASGSGPALPVVAVARRRARLARGPGSDFGKFSKSGFVFHSSSSAAPLYR